MAEIPPNLVKDINLHLQNLREPSQQSKYKSACLDIHNQTTRNQTQGEHFENSQRNNNIYLQGNNDINITDLSEKKWKPRDSGTVSLKHSHELLHRDPF